MKIASKGREVGDFCHFVASSTRKAQVKQFILCIFCAYTRDRRLVEFQATKY